MEAAESNCWSSCACRFEIHLQIKGLTPKDAAWETEFFAYFLSHKQSSNQQKQSQNHVFHVRTRQSAKN